MFSQACVILFTGGRVHPGCTPRCTPWIHPLNAPPPMHPPDAPPPVDALPPVDAQTVNKQSIGRYLLGNKCVPLLALVEITHI